MKIKTAPDWEIDTTVSSTNLLNPPYIYPIRQKSNTCPVGCQLTVRGVDCGENMPTRTASTIAAALIEAADEIDG